MWAGQLISEAGTQMQMVAIGWHVYILTQAPVALGLLGLIRVLASPDHLRGRMTSIIRFFSHGGPQRGNLAAGLLAALIGAPLSVISGGIATLFVVGFVAWKIPLLRDFRG